MKKINRIFIYILFILVFVISSLLIALPRIPQLENKHELVLRTWFISSICCLFVFGIVWLIVYLYFKRNKTTTANSLKIKKIVKK